MMRRLLTLDACIFLLGVVALILVGLLRSAFITTYPLVSFVSTLILFMVPGMVTVRWFFDEPLSGAVMVPVSFALSAGIFALSGVPLLMAHASFELYLWIISGILAASLAAAAFRALGRKPSAENGTAVSFSFSWLWIPFLLLNTALAAMSTARVQAILGDMWVYLAWVREFLTTNKLALREPYFGNTVGASRAQIDGWLLEQAALSKVSGIDPINFVLGYLRPTLVVMSLLAFYALARVLLKSETGALLASSLYTLFFLINLDPTAASLGGELIGRVAEDKFVSWFLFLPVGLTFALLFLESHRLRYLIVFTFLCWVVVAVHPVGLAILGLSTAGFGLLYLATELRDKGAWIRTVSLGAALNSVLLAPLLYFLITGDSFVAVLNSADLDYSDPQVENNMVFLLPQRAKIFELGSNYYIMHPSLLLNPAILVALVVGLPFLLWRLKRSLPAQLLVGMLLVSTVICYVPSIATFLGNHIILPGQLWRLAWPIPLAGLLTVGWMVWEMTCYAQIGLNELKGPRQVVQFFPLVVLCALMVVAAPASVANAKDVYSAAEIPLSAQSRFDPIFRWIGNNIQETSVVFAPDWVNTCIPAYSAQANVVSLRGEQVLRHLGALERRAPGQIEVPQGALDARMFYSRFHLEGKLRILQRHKVDYVMVRAGSHLSATLKSQPGFTAMNTPVVRYTLYAVNRSKLPGS